MEKMIFDGVADSIPGNPGHLTTDPVDSDHGGGLYMSSIDVSESVVSR
jgi:hypothetical protein